LHTAVRWPRKRAGHTNTLSNGHANALAGEPACLWDAMKSRRQLALTVHCWRITSDALVHSHISSEWGQCCTEMRCVAPEAVRRAATSKTSKSGAGCQGLHCSRTRHHGTASSPAAGSFVCLAGGKNAGALVCSAHAHTQTYNMQMDLHTCTRTHEHARACTHTHMHTHTHAHAAAADTAAPGSAAGAAAPAVLHLVISPGV